MALIDCHFSSEALGMSTAIKVILPRIAAGDQGNDGAAPKRTTYPALYLLHGWSDDESIWTRRTSIERYVANLPLAVIMPRVDLSYYQDTADGRRYWSYIADELPRLCEQWFPLRTDRDSRWAAGLSMGGYGAFRLGLQRPDRYSHVASLSGAVDLEAVTKMWYDSPTRRSLMHGIFGDSSTIADSDANLFRHLPRTESKTVQFYQWCGADDFLLEGNRNFYRQATDAKLKLQYHEGPGDHSWEHWDREIQGVLNWLPIKA